MFRISAKQGIPTSEIRGPTIFKKDKSVEFTIFLPFDEIPNGAAFSEPALNFLLDGVRDVFASIGINATELNTARSDILGESRRNPAHLPGIKSAEQFSGGNGG